MSKAKSTLEQWRILQAVVDHGGYAQAAAQLNRSQSSLNHAVAKLQDQLGVTLLVVKGRKAQLTDAGEMLLRRSRGLTYAINEIEQLAGNLHSGWEPTLTIAREIVYPTHHLVDALSAFEPQSRGTRVTIIDSVINGTKELIEAEQVDIAIVGGLPPTGHLIEPLCEIDFALVCHPQHPLASHNEELDDHTLSQHLQIVIKDTGLKNTDDIGWLKAEQRWTVSNFHEALVILAKPIGFCWIPQHLVAQSLANGSLYQLTLKGGTRRRVMTSLVIPNRDRQGPASKLVEQLILNQHLKPVEPK
ncbi:LysR family transcriptional regulator [Shewanella sp. Scap07]|uniref:LysR family transcriptional regulator n=1 Tax=Shewanella sp. Scap07 TaxID=2589987 RepID=UPI0015BF1037|nr:LysR family transcriptional regulator [Shewanella sp. Scap07]QLE85688.1 LysR family transcriptional regulator [Shewanella sp. Scap07]